MKQKNNGVNFFFFGSVVTRVYVYVTSELKEKKDKVS